MDKQTEKQEFKEKLGSKLSETNNAQCSIYDDASKFKAEDSVIELIQSLNKGNNE